MKTEKIIAVKVVRGICFRIEREREIISNIWVRSEREREVAESLNLSAPLQTTVM